MVRAVGLAAECKRIAAEAIAKFGAVDVLVNNAAIRPSDSFLAITEEKWRRVLAVDLDAAFWLAQACLPSMIEKKWGRIVNFVGMNAIHGYAGRAHVSVAPPACSAPLATPLARGAGMTCAALPPGGFHNALWASAANTIANRTNTDLGMLPPIFLER